MNNITRAVGQALFIGLLLLFAVPAGYIAVRIGDTWTAHYTEQVLGWLTAICGGSLLLCNRLHRAGRPGRAVLVSRDRSRGGSASTTARDAEAG